MKTDRDCLAIYFPAPRRKVRRPSPERSYVRPDGVHITIYREGREWCWYKTDDRGVGPIDGMTGVCETLREAMDDAQVTTVMLVRKD